MYKCILGVGVEMLVFRKTWCALSSCNHRFEIQLFDSLPQICFSTDYFGYFGNKIKLLSPKPQFIKSKFKILSVQIKQVNLIQTTHSFSI